MGYGPGSQNGGWAAWLSPLQRPLLQQSCGSHNARDDSARQHPCLPGQRCCFAAASAVLALRQKEAPGVSGVSSASDVSSVSSGDSMPRGKGHVDASAQSATRPAPRVWRPGRRRTAHPQLFYLRRQVCPRARLLPGLWPARIGVGHDAAAGVGPCQQPGQLTQVWEQQQRERGCSSGGGGGGALAATPCTPASPHIPHCSVAVRITRCEARHFQGGGSSSKPGARAVAGWTGATATCVTAGGLYCDSGCSAVCLPVLL